MIWKTLVLAPLLTVLVLMLALVFGGPGAPPPPEPGKGPMDAVDFRDLPALLHYPADDGSALAYRHYPPANAAAKGSVVVLHGSTSHGKTMHVLCKALAAAAYHCYALDIRGHGSSGPLGTVAYVGQLEDDLAAFVKTVPLLRPLTLAGFSLGGGLALRFAGSQRQDLFQQYLLLSPFFSRTAPNYRKALNGWAPFGYARNHVLRLLNWVGVTRFNDLPVVRFGISPQPGEVVTASYSYALAANFRPWEDYQTNIRAVHQPVAVVVGTADEAFYADQVEPVLRQQGKSWPVTLLPGIGHLGLTLDPRATGAVVSVLDQLSTLGRPAP